MRNQKTIGIILARGGSKGLQHKNLRLINGIPLIAKAVLDALAADCLDSLIVSTDDPKIAAVAERYGAEIPFIRPPELSGDLSTTETCLQHALIEYERLKGKQFGIGVFLTATDIFRQKNWIAECVNTLKSNADLESVFVGTKTHKNFWEKNADGSWERIRDWMSIYSSRQVRRTIIREDTGLACASRATLWRSGRRIGDKVHIIKNDDDFAGLDIHSIEDLLLAEAALKIRKNINNA